VFNSELKKLIAKHANNGILVDSNLLLIFCIGSLDPSLVQREKGTREYTLADFSVLQEFLRGFRRLRTTPNILTELSNLTGRLRNDVRKRVTLFIREKTVDAAWQEDYIATSEATLHYTFEQLGLTDASIGVLSDRGLLVLSNDLNLSLILESRGGDCVHYDRTLRPIALEMG
jgi:hypothetical protein